MTDLAPDDLKLPLLHAMLQHVPFDGWSEKALEAAIRDCGTTMGHAKLAFPDDIPEIIEYWSEETDREMLRRCPPEMLAPLKVRERIALLVRTRLEILAPHKDAEQRALAHFGLPFHTPRAAAMLYRLTDAIWRAAGDTAFDFNFYSKRATLGAVYASTLLYFMGDDSEDHEETWSFLERRIGDIMKIESAKAKLRSKCSDPEQLFSRLIGWRQDAMAESSDNMTI